MQDPIQTHGRDSGALNHPSPEDWVAYVYGETPRASRPSLRTHLDQCATCRATVARWQAARAGLAEWRLEKPAALKRVPVAFPTLKWALAALVVLGLGFMVGRVSLARTDRKAWRAALEPELRASLAGAVQQQVQREFLADWQAVLTGGPEAMATDFRRRLRSDLELWKAHTVEASKAESERLLVGFVETYHANRRRDQAAVLTLFDRAEEQHRAAHLDLRRALETVAVIADDKFQRTESELGQLASYAEAQFISDKSNTPFAPVNSLNSKGRN